MFLKMTSRVSLTRYVIRNDTSSGALQLLQHIPCQFRGGLLKDLSYEKRRTRNPIRCLFFLTRLHNYVLRANKSLSLCCTTQSCSMYFIRDDKSSLRKRWLDERVTIGQVRYPGHAQPLCTRRDNNTDVAKHFLSKTSHPSFLRTSPDF